MNFAAKILIFLEKSKKIFKQEKYYLSLACENPVL
jgi:hypothetical protein